MAEVGVCIAVRHLKCILGISIDITQENRKTHGGHLGSCYERCRLV